MKGMFRLFVAVCFLFVAHPVSAATLYIEQQEAEMQPGDSIVLAVRIDTDDDECINVVDGVVHFSPNIIPVDYSLGNSILPFWVEEPTIDKENNTVTFAGGIPNGYCGRIPGDPRLTNIVLELVVQSPGFQPEDTYEPTADITFGEETRVLLNDGAGTPATLRTFGSTVYVQSDFDGVITDEWKERVQDDTIPPSEFSISLNKDLSAYGGRYFIVFNTTDKQTGIDHYEVMEEPLDAFELFSWGGIDAPWVPARSPYLLEDQSLNSTIRVKAVDKAGNEYIATLVPDDSERGMNVRTIVVTSFMIIGLLMLLGLGVVLYLYRRRNTVRDQADEMPYTHTSVHNDTYDE